MEQVNSYAAQQPTTPLAPFKVERRKPRPGDILIDILYCGVCHSDIHTARNEWKNTIYPVVPGHEIIGKVVQVGKDVKAFKEGEIVAVGCMVDSCASCENCCEGLEQYCDVVPIFTYNGKDKYDQSITYGGYSTQIVVDQKFVLHVPKEYREADYPRVAPLFVRWHYHLFSFASLESGQGKSCRGSGDWGSWTFGYQDCTCDGSVCGGFYNVSK